MIVHYGKRDTAKPAAAKPEQASTRPGDVMQEAVPHFAAQAGGRVGFNRCLRSEAAQACFATLRPRLRQQSESPAILRAARLRVSKKERRLGTFSTACGGWIRRVPPDLQGENRLNRRHSPMQHIFSSGDDGNDNKCPLHRIPILANHEPDPGKMALADARSPLRHAQPFRPPEREPPPTRNAQQVMLPCGKRRAALQSGKYPHASPRPCRG